MSEKPEHLLTSVPYPSEQKNIECILSAGRIKILKALSTVEMLTVNEIHKRTELNHTVVYDHLRILEDEGLLCQKFLGNTRLYGYNEDSAKSIKVRQFIIAYTLSLL